MGRQLEGTAGRRGRAWRRGALRHPTAPTQEESPPPEEPQAELVAAHLASRPGPSRRVQGEPPISGSPPPSGSQRLPDAVAGMCDPGGIGLRSGC